MISPELDLKPIHDALQVGLAPDEICIREGIVLKICEESRFPFEFFCWRSPPMVKEMDCFLKYIKDQRCFLDVGAFHGLFTLVFEHRGFGAIAIEPSDAFRVLEKNWELNNLGRSPMNIALSDQDGSLNMQAEDGHWVAQESRRFDVDNPQQSRCRTGDDMVDSRNQKGSTFDPHTIKIDVEGHEVKVLRGLQGTISQLRPLIFLEVHLPVLKKQGESTKDILELLPNYRFLYTGTEEEVDFSNLPEFEENDPHFVCLPV